MFTLYWAGVILFGGLVVAVWNRMYPKHISRHIHPD